MPCTVPLIKMNSTEYQSVKLHMIFGTPLEVIHEGTNKVKEAKISSLVRKYELFKMNKDEPITEMFTRFTNITNDLKSLEKPIPRLIR